jgi:light-regulated signal transduction histidine kinase (bacteriophytochrome)
LIDQQGEVDMVITTITDITVQREAENMLMKEQKDSAERLEKLVALRTKELQESNEGLQHFAHVASHDLKEPVRKIKIFGDRLLTEFQDALPEKALAYLEKIEKAADRMYTMIEGVLRYSSFEAMQKAFEDVDMQTLMESIESDLELLIHQKHARIVYSRLPRIRGVHVLLHQLFYNLINNSLKFSKPGVPPVVELKASECEIGGKAYLCITVEDNGIGFENENAKKIFHTFARLHPKDIYDGTGLGLSLCKKIVEKHQGMIWATSEPGVGSVFTVMLPLVPTSGGDPS